MPKKVRKSKKIKAKKARKVAIEELDPIRFALGKGIIFAIFLALLALAPAGKTIVQLLGSSIMPGYVSSGGGAVIGILYGLVYGCIFGYIFAFIYNYLRGKV